jgi:hypothetical protein
MINLYQNGMTMLKTAMQIQNERQVTPVLSPKLTLSTTYLLVI